MKEDKRIMNPKTLKQLIEANEFNFVNDNVTETNFPTQKIRGKVEIIDLKREVTSEEAIKEMDEKGYYPANIYELLRWANQNKEEKKWNGTVWVVALGSVWQDWRGPRRAPCLYGASDGRHLRLPWWGSEWCSDYRFAFVRKSR